jgi:hypothetical protein
MLRLIPLPFAFAALGLAQDALAPHSAFEPRSSARLSPCSRWAIRMKRRRSTSAF